MIVIRHRKSSDVVLMRIDASGLDDRDLSGAYLLGAGMAGLRARRVVLREANLRNADLRATDLTAADLSGAVLRGADFRGADLSGASLAGADLRAANLCRADLRGADLTRAMLFEADLTDVRCDFRTQWPAGADWGVVARPAEHPETVLQRAGANSYYQSVRRRALEWRVGASSAYRQHGVRMATGVAGRMAGAALAALLLVTVASSLGVIHGARARRPSDGTPQVATRVPLEPSETQTDPAQILVRPETHVVLAQPRHPVVVRKRELPRSSPRGGAHVARAHVARERIARSDQPRSNRPVLLSSHHRNMVEGRYITAGRAGGRAANVWLAAYTPSRARPRGVARVTGVQVPTPVEQPTVARVAVTPVRPQTRWEPRAGRVPVAWGNPEFHYGSGYDIYTMHLDRRQE